MSYLLDRFIDEKEIIICGGSGGVGKTTTSAAIAIRAAQRGKNVLVLTIDPARRLADALGIKIGNEETEVPLGELGLNAPGTLHAMMLDMKRSFDELIEKISPTREVAERIFSNRLYQNITTAFSGSHEYIAMEKVYDIHRSGRYDLIVLDTPPTRHAIDFLEAPKKMVDFLNAGIINIMLKLYFQTGKIGLKIFRGGIESLFMLVERVTGGEILREVSEFFLSFEGLYDGFKNRSDAVMKLLKSQKSVFLIIMGPQEVNLDEAFFLYDKISEMGLPFGFFIMNRVHLLPEGFKWDRDKKRKLESLIEEDEKFIFDWIEKYISLSKRDREVAMNVISRTKQPLYLVPEFPEDVHDITSLKNFIDNLMSGEILR